MGRLLRGALVGAAGTAVMTAVQRAVQGPPGGEAPSWRDAPAPAQVAGRALGAVGARPPARWIPPLTQVMHWGYGTTWGLAYALARGRTPRRVLVEGPAFGLLVWAASYAELVPLGIYRPPWTYGLRTIAEDVGYHVAFGVGTVAAADVLRPRG